MQQGSALMLNGEAGPADDGSAHAAPGRFTPGFLAIYDWAVLGFVSTFAWRCPSRHILGLYDRHVSSNHLDVGVGTGYFLDRCRFPTPSPTITLLDVNPNPLQTAARRLRRYRPRTRLANILEPIDLDGAKVDSIGLGYLLHCLPGNFSTKAVALENLKGVLNEGGVLFGSTILGRGVPHNALARRILARSNEKGIFSNLEDDPEGLKQALTGVFREHRVRIIGSVALFAARS